MLATPEVSYLGNSVTRDGLFPDPSLLRVILEIPAPQNVKEFWSFFLGLASYYPKYIKGFTIITSSLHTLTKKNAVVHCAPECKDAFAKLKHLLTTAPTTAFTKYVLPFWLFTDASTLDLGAILAQAQEGWERIICCASRTLSQTEKSYPATKLEWLAVVWATAKLHPFDVE